MRFDESNKSPGTPGAASFRAGQNSGDGEALDICSYVVLFVAIIYLRKVLAVL